MIGGEKVVRKIDLQRIKEAHSRIQKYVKKTPLLYSRVLSEKCEGEVYLKLENQQHTNTFKFRGAVNKMAELSSKEAKAGIVTASSGNHAQGVALAAKTLGIKATIFVPREVSALKLEKLKKYDVEIVQGGEYNEVEPRARAYGLEHGQTYISPYNDYGIIAGQGTIALEIEEDLKEFDSVIVPVGGGGLISGIAVAVKSLHPDRSVFGVVTPGAPSLREALLAGKIVKVKEFETLAEAFLGGIEEDALTFDVVKEYVNEIFLVQEDSVANAMRLLWNEEQQIVEGAGATSTAVILENGEFFKDKRVVVIVSGGNVADSLFSEIVGKE